MLDVPLEPVLLDAVVLLGPAVPVVALEVVPLVVAADAPPAPAVVLAVVAVVVRPVVVEAAPVAPVVVLAAGALELELVVAPVPLAAPTLPVADEAVVLRGKGTSSAQALFFDVARQAARSESHWDGVGRLQMRSHALRQVKTTSHETVSQVSRQRSQASGGSTQEAFK